MNPFEMVVLIILIVTIGRVMQSRHRLRASGGSPGAEPVAPAETMRLRDEVRRLSERVQVLERVITDDRKSIDLTQEIERLRDR